MSFLPQLLGQNTFCGPTQPHGDQKVNTYQKRGTLQEFGKWH